MIKILMHGCNGRMGQMISGLVREEESLTIAAGVDSYLGIANDIRCLKPLMRVI